MLNIETHLFSKRRNEDVARERVFMDGKFKDDVPFQSFQSHAWMQKNKLFGETIDAVDKTKNMRMDKKPRMKTNTYNDRKYPDKAKFLTRFSCFDGYMQELDISLRTDQDIECLGLDKKNMREALVN